MKQRPPRSHHKSRDRNRPDPKGISGIDALSARAEVETSQVLVAFTFAPGKIVDRVLRREHGSCNPIYAWLGYISGFERASREETAADCGEDQRIEEVRKTHNEIVGLCAAARGPLIKYLGRTLLVSHMIERWFRLKDNHTTAAREILGGTTTFLTLSYIIFVEPGVLEQAGMSFQAVMVATCLAAALATFLMGLAANYPIALAPGMGENFFFVYTLCGAYKLSWQQALAATFLAGLAFMLLSVFGLRSKVVNAIPASLKTGIAAGIGLFITLIGMQYGRLVVSHPSTLLQLGDLRSPVALTTLGGLLLTLALTGLRVRGAILLGILGSTLLAASLGLVRYSGMVAWPSGLEATLWKMDFAGLLSHPPGTVAAAVFVLLFLALFDTVGTLVGVTRQAGLMRPDGTLPRAERALLADATGTVAGAALGTSTVTCYIESAAGVSDGARTGLANMVTAALLVVAAFFTPLARMIGGGVPDPQGGVAYPTLAPALILVGAMIMRSVRDLEWDDPTEAVPAFLTMILIPFSFSIASGVAAGFLAYAAAKLLTGRPRECPALVYVFAILYLLQYGLR